jgi:hypothetical protein
VNVEDRERFFRAIAERIDVERVEEVHVFPAIRQGGRESGVAVVTLRPLPAEPEAAAEGVGDARDVEHGGSSSDLEESGSGGDAGVAEEAEDVVDGEELQDMGSPVDTADVGADDEPRGTDQFAAVTPELIAAPDAPRQPRRFTVLRADYRLQLKGPDRGRWEVGVVEEADAPAATVDEVVRGVHERAGGWSVEGPERLTGDEFRAALAEEPWSATR